LGAEVLPVKKAGARDLLAPWAGLIGGLMGLAVVHQFGSEGMFDSCAVVSPVPLLIVALLGIVLAIVSGLASLSVLRGHSETPVRKLVATISLGAVGLFCFAMLLPMIASLVLPPCFQ
jgi:membrane associated rhomboid family serine protease